MLSSVLAATSAAMKSILIADDNEWLRKLIGHFLKSTPGYQVHEAVNGEDAVCKASELKLDLIILDVAMPKMNGLEAAKKLRQIQVSAPIILFTMYAQELSQTLVAESGVNAIVPKPDLTALHRQIEFLLSNRGPARTRSAAM